MDSNIIENAKVNHKKTMEKFKKAGGRFLFYDANNIDNEEKFKPIVIAESEIELIKTTNEKISKNPDKYKKVKFVQVVIKGNDSYIGLVEFPLGLGGSLGIDLSLYTLNINNKLVHGSNDAYAVFWYNDSILASKGFSVNHVRKAIKILLKNVLVSNPFIVYYIDKLSEYAMQKKKKQ